jgi:hypothetical protein
MEQLLNPTHEGLSRRRRGHHGHHQQQLNNGSRTIGRDAVSARPHLVSASVWARRSSAVGGLEIAGGNDRPRTTPDHSQHNAAEANRRANQLHPILAELAGLSANKAADELNRRGIATPKRARWHALTVMRLRKRL